MTRHSIERVGEQAQALRSLMERLNSNRKSVAEDVRTVRAHSVAVTSGKGGVGKSNVALNLAIALARSGAQTCLMDANLGLGNIDLLCGLNGYWNLSHVVTGARTLRDVVLTGPEGVNVVPGASGLAELSDWSAAVQRDVFQQLEELEMSHDFLVIDTAAGIHRLARKFLDACDLVLVVTTPEPTSIADAYSLIKGLSARATGRIEALVNQCDSPDLAARIAARLQETTRLFLQADVGAAGFVPADPEVRTAVARRTPFVVANPGCHASRAMDQLAAHVKRLFDTSDGQSSFFPRMQHPPIPRPTGNKPAFAEAT
jgi:flagellar biosynthesis protein FlhG